VIKTNALESLVIASFVRGLSVRDVEAALTEALGDQAAVSKSTVSAICGQIKKEYQAWAERRLDDAQLILGHSRLAVTLEIYSHEDRHAQRDALGRISDALGHGSPARVE
jgi:hypothetical protein